MSRHRTIFFLAVASTFSGAVLGACGDSEDRPSFVGLEEAGPDAAPATLPDAGSRAADAAARDYDAADERVACAVTPCATALVAGDNHFCALVSDGTVRCWGSNAKGALGTGDESDALLGPGLVVGVSNATQISAAELATCARDAEGRVKCWGGNGQGQLGLQASTPGLADGLAHATPADVALDAELARVDVGRRTVCALARVGGDVYCWGQNDQMQLARPDAGASATGGPDLAYRRDFEITRTSGGQASLFGITADGLLAGWGAVSGRETSISPTAIMNVLPTLRDVTTVAAGPRHACAIAGGRLYCWGNSSYGVLGTGVPESARIPTPAVVVTNDKVRPQQLAVSTNMSCVRMTDGSVHCAGDARYARGRTDTFAASFVRVDAVQGHAVQIATSGRAVCALERRGEVVCWGTNVFGELGQGTRDDDLHPNPVRVQLQ